MRNYFSDLELDLNASLEDIRRAYRRLAKEFHPDLHPNDLNAEEAFKRISEAFRALGSLSRIQKVKKALSPFEDELRRSRVTKSKWTYKAKRRQTKAEAKGSRPKEELDLLLHLELTENELEKGGKQEIEYAFEKPCLKCRGKGLSSKAAQITCKDCAGVGSQLISRGAYRWKKTCENCGGKGYQSIGACSLCHGYGKVQDKQILTINLKPPLKVGQKFELENLGHLSFDSKKRGNLILKISAK